MSEIMALHGPGVRLDGLTALRRNTPPPGTKERLEAGLERLHRLWTTTLARYIDLLDAETPDADFEPSLAGMGGQAGSGDDREADFNGGWSGSTSDDEPLQGWTESQSRCGRFGGAYAMDDDEHSLGSLGGTAVAGQVWSVRLKCWRQPVPFGSQVRWASGRANDFEAQCEDEGAEHDGREPDDEGDGDPDREPSLGATERIDQRRWGAEQEPGLWPTHGEPNGDDLGDHSGAEGEGIGVLRGPLA